MTVQSTPTPTDDLKKLIGNANKEARLRGLATNDDMAKIIVAAGWKSPTEVAELVREASRSAWEEGALWSAVETDTIRSTRQAWLLPDDNPHNDHPTPETVPSDV